MAKKITTPYIQKIFGSFLNRNPHLKKNLEMKGALVILPRKLTWPWKITMFKYV